MAPGLVDLELLLIIRSRRPLLGQGRLLVAGRPFLSKSTEMRAIRPDVALSLVSSLRSSVEPPLVSSPFILLDFAF